MTTGMRRRGSGRWPALALAVVAGCAGCGDRAPGGRDGPAVEAIASPAAAGSGGPHLAAAADGSVVLSWLEPDGQAHALRFATLDGAAWSAPRTLARGEDWFVNWADFPSVVPLADDLWAAHWLVRRAEGGYAYDVAVSLSRDRGRSWSPPLNPHRDGTPTEHGFVTLFPWQGGAGAVWLDGREMLASGHGHDHGHAGARQTAHGGGMTLRTALIGADGALREEALLDGLTCDCCQTDVALTDAGPVVFYRDRSAEEIRDIGDWIEQRLG